MQIQYVNSKASLKSLKKRLYTKQRSSRPESLIYSVRILACNGESLSQSPNRILTFSQTCSAHNSRNINKFIPKSYTISVLNYIQPAMKQKTRSWVNSMIDFDSEIRALSTCTHLNPRSMTISKASLNRSLRRTPRNSLNYLNRLKRLKRN